MRYKERDESFEKNSYRQNRLLKYSLVFITIYLIVLSLLPLVANALNKSGFIVIGLTPYMLGTFKFSTGSYLYTSSNYQIVFSDANQTGDKPHIFLYTHSLPSLLVDLVEVSDRESMLNSAPLFQAIATTRLINSSALSQAYRLDGSTLQKIIYASSNGTAVAYTATGQSSLQISLWRWYFAEVNGVNKTAFNSSSISMANVSKITFSYDDIAQGNGTVILSRLSNITIERDDIGINKVLVNSPANLTLSITGSLSSAKVSQLTIFVAESFSNLWVLLAFPAITVLILAFAWVKWSK